MKAPRFVPSESESERLCRPLPGPVAAGATQTASVSTKDGSVKPQKAATRQNNEHGSRLRMAVMC